MYRFAFALLIVGVLAPTNLIAQDVVPDRTLSLIADMDYPGGDLRPLFDTTMGNCQAVCRADPDCQGFTFNTRNNACFPKSRLGEGVPFAGAISGLLRPTDPAVLSNIRQRIADLDGLNQSDLSGAYDQALGMANAHFANNWTLGQLRQSAIASAAAGDAPAAARLMGAAITLSDAAADWTAYASYLLASQDNSYSQRWQRERDALFAATNAALRATTSGDLSAALSVVAQALETQGRGRDMIPVLRLAVAQAPDANLRAALERALGLYGFRLTDTQVDNESEFPRICTIFSDPLAEGGVNYDDFVQTTHTGLSVEAEGQQLCISGVSHGARYEVTLRAGLPAASGEVLRAPIAIRQYVRDRAPSVRFAGRAYILPQSDSAALPIAAVNTDSVDLRLFRVSDRNIVRSLQQDYFGRPLSDWEIDSFANELAETVWEGSAEVATELNRAITTRLPMTAIMTGMEPGLYALEARVSEQAAQDQVPATQWFLISDLGLTTLSGADGVHVIVRSLATAGARAGLLVQLLSESNRLLGEAVTDADGYAHFDAGLTRGRAGAAPAMISVSDGDGDFAFLSLRETEFDLSDRGVEGREPPAAINVFLTTDRGAYRAGEVIHATALARDDRAGALTGLPLTAILQRADGVEHSRLLLEETGAGGYVFALQLGADVPRGTWRLAVHADVDAAPLATTSLLVEDFLPERLDLTIGLPEGRFVAGDRVLADFNANYLYGAAAAGLTITGRLTLRPTSELAEYPGYLFGRHDGQPAPAFGNFGPIETNGQGSATAMLDFPRFEGAVGHPGVLTVTAEIVETSGRPVERTRTATIAPDGPAIGIRPLFDGVLPEGAEAAFDVIATGANALPVRWALNRVERRYQWYSQDGNWSWEPVTTRERVASGEATIGDTATRITAPVNWGEYELRVETEAGGFAISSVGFSAGWYATADSAGTPDLLEVSLDADSYRPGDTALLRIVPRQGGVALVQVLSNRLIAMQIVEVGDDPTTIALPVTDDWGSGAYVTASLIRPLNGLDGQTPTRALGLTHATVAPGDRALTVVLETPEEAQPRGPLEVILRVEDAISGDTVHATIAAVDLGILNLTSFESPDPQEHYFGQRRLGMAIRDVYGRLIDSRDGAEGRIRQGGDAAGGLRMQAPPPTEELLAEFSGVLTVGRDGLARATFDLPAFNGTVRLMAVAWSDTGVGQAQADVLVRDPVVVTASLPRFLSPGDTTRLLLEFTHAYGPTGDMAVEVQSSAGINTGGPLGRVTLGMGGTARLSIPVTAGQIPGLQDVTVTLTTPDGTTLQRNLRIPIQVNDPEVAETSRITLAPGAAFTLDAVAFSGLRTGTGRATIAAGPLARFDVPGLLQMLDRYPYGCTEQITSSALPLLYMATVAEAMDLATAADLGARIDDAISRVLVNQAANGGFGLWFASSGDLWLDAYVTDFLSRARSAGHEVPARAFANALDNLRNQVAAYPDFENGGEDLAYALMVLARESAASMGDLRYYADVKADEFATPLALGQLGAALAMYGDQPRADAMFRAGYTRLQTLAAEGEGQVWRADYGSDRRDAAGLLALAAGAGSTALPLENIAATLSPADRPVSTQEAVWSLLAANALIDMDAASGLNMNGTPVSGPLIEVLRAGDTTTRVITNDGATDEVLTFTRFGIPEGTTESSGNGFRIMRAYLDMDGQPIEPTTVEQGTRMIALLTITPFGVREGRLMVSDPLPAGFEIDNPNLLQAGDLSATQGLNLRNAATHTEFRQDRFLAAVDMFGDDVLRFAYIVRAVTPGAFHHPAASVEDMYRPQYRAQTASGFVTVAE